MAPPNYQYPVWTMGLRAAMEHMLTGSSMSGKEAVRVGFANRVFPDEDLEEKTLEMAIKVSKIPPDLQILNKRSVWQAMEVKGFRTAIRAGFHLQNLAWFQKSSREYIQKLYSGDLKKALTERDGKWGDYRTTKDKKG